MSDNRPARVTIVTVTYNAAALLEETIQSVLSQDGTDIEYIIVDGGSTDGTVDIIRRYESRLAFWVSEPDRGVFDAMNKALSHASGEWVNFMNAGDSFVDVHTVAKVLEVTSDGVDVICGDNYIVDAEGKRVYSKAPGFDDVWRSVIPCNHQSMFFRRERLWPAPFDRHYALAADYELMVRLYTEGARFHFLAWPVCNFLAGGMAHANAAKLQIESLMVMAKYAPDLSQSLAGNIHLVRLASVLGTEAAATGFAEDFNRFYAHVQKLAASDQRIAIYGAGSIGRVLAAVLPGRVCCFVDRGDLGSSVDGVPAHRPEALQDVDFDTLVISLVGREKEIGRYLVDEIGIPADKLYTLTL